MGSFLLSMLQPDPPRNPSLQASRATTRSSWLNMDRELVPRVTTRSTCLDTSSTCRDREATRDARNKLISFHAKLKKPGDSIKAYMIQ